MTLFFIKTINIYGREKSVPSVPVPPLSRWICNPAVCNLTTDTFELQNGWNEQRITNLNGRRLSLRGKAPKQSIENLNKKL